MSVTILVCPCGRRLKAAGMAPGKTGRCPECGRTLRMPERAPSETAVSDEDVFAMLRLPEPAPVEPAPVPPAADEDEWNWQGTYDVDPAEPPRSTFRPLEPTWTLGPSGPWLDEPDEPEDLAAPEEPVPVEPVEVAAAEGEWDWRGMYDLDASAPTPAPGPEEPRGAVDSVEVHPAAAPIGWGAKEEDESDEPRRPDPWWPPRLLYPLRGAESLSMVAALGGTAWVMGTLIPEYCLGILADAEVLGTPSMGYLVALITAIPALVLSPLVGIYGLQYLARVLVAASEGETRPPRPPDRNADGVLSGMGAWLLWLVLGASVAVLPLTSYSLATAARDQPLNPGLAAALGLAGLPYALMALLLTFLHDDALAARPGMVLGTIARLGPSFLGLSLTIAGVLGLAVPVVAAALALRAAAFWVYIPACLGFWMIAVWIAIVAMHTLGAYYAPRRERLKWRRKRLRWGAK